MSQAIIEDFIEIRRQLLEAEILVLRWQARSMEPTPSHLEQALRDWHGAAARLQMQLPAHLRRTAAASVDAAPLPGPGSS